MPMIDARCKKCGHFYGWCGEVVDQPDCPKCGNKPDRVAIEHDQKQIDEFRRFLTLKASDTKHGDLRRMRKVAGLNLSQVSKITGYGIVQVSRWERGEDMPTNEQALKLLEVYGFGEEQKDGE